MKGPRALLATALLAGGPAAQDLVFIPMRCQDALDRAAETAKSERKVVVSRLKALVDRLSAAENRSTDGGRLLQLHDQGPEQLLLVRDTQANVDLVEKAVERMRQENPERPTELRMQCTLLLVPADVAADHELAAERTMPATTDAVTRLLRDTVKGGGELHNLPEAVTRPFVSFTLGRRAPKPAEPPRPADDASPRVRGLAAGIEADVFVLDLELEHEAARTRLHRALRLERGKGALVTGKAGEDDRLPVIWVRLLAAR